MSLVDKKNSHYLVIALSQHNDYMRKLAVLVKKFAKLLYITILKVLEMALIQVHYEVHA